ncbi:hypothetical protein SCUCBS95973_001496 [Sporothrix curviconia]|uniref:Uncharacterized protein n=1 Tax=Sporothrix curviconia TaxID=1260050 RepID=A0ABP0AZ28_9PEZI
MPLAEAIALITNRQHWAVVDEEQRQRQNAGYELSDRYTAQAEADSKRGWFRRMVEGRRPAYVEAPLDEESGNEQSGDQQPDDQQPGDQQSDQPADQPADHPADQEPANQQPVVDMSAANPPSAAAPSTTAPSAAAPPLTTGSDAK